MSWLTQNLIWILLLAGVFFLMRRGATRSGCGHAHNSAHPEHADARKPSDAPGGADTQTCTDPVSGQAVDPNIAAKSVFRGRTYYFVTRESRDRFEAAPDRYAAQGQDRSAGKSHVGHRHGCC
ncbi:YHS domain-containing protein [Niveibacterium sp. SC-1]|uniref:YHS domain-containing protein n=1 Tax=Niveibacterium sp. SC-1 TaxID=3135646 RepID=UPI00311D6984